ncbi:MAG TPA: hypothetical protein DCY88_33800 [Cyanobacteria bacterium UBA11372]|nr:hypothetical protein [Cyanobacteria bacterium UBA11372]
MVTVRLLKKSDGKPIWGEKIYISRHGSGFLDVGGVFGSEKTNKDGEVCFFKLDLPARGKIVVDGHEIYDGELEKIMIFRI